MPQFDVLALVAELAVAIAGFASLVGLVGQWQGRDAASVDTMRLRSMIETSLLAAGLALLPRLPYEAGLSVEGSWRASGAVFALAALLFSARLLRRTRGVEARTRSYRLTRGWGLIVGAIQLSSLALLGASAFGFYPRPAAAYLFALYAYLAMAGMLFLRFVASVLAGSRAPAD